MTVWIVIWKVFFVLTIAVFVEMAVLVTWFGAGDIWRLLRRLRGDEEVSEQSPPDD